MSLTTGALKDLSGKIWMAIQVSYLGRGIGWYRKRFNIKNIDKDKMFFLDFAGVMANAEVYLNGKKIGERPYGYISFRVNLTALYSL